MRGWSTCGWWCVASLLLLACTSVAKFREAEIDVDETPTCSEFQGVPPDIEGCWSGCGSTCNSMMLAKEARRTHKLEIVPGRYRTCKLPKGRKSRRVFCQPREATAGEVDHTLELEQHHKLINGHTDLDEREAAWNPAAGVPETPVNQRNPLTTGPYDQQQPPQPPPDYTVFYVVLGVVVLVAISAAAFVVISRRRSRDDDDDDYYDD